MIQKETYFDGWPPEQSESSVCSCHRAARGSNPKHNNYAFTIDVVEMCTGFIIGLRKERK